jgi:DNA-binding protein YbaB
MVTARSSGFGDDPLQEIRQIYDDVVSAVQNIAPGPELTASFEGTDQSGAVKVAAGPDGRLKDLTLNRAWSRKLTAAELGPAVLEALQDAAVRRLQAWGETVAGAPARAEATDMVVGKTRPAAPRRAQRRFTPKPFPVVGPPGDPSTPEAQEAAAELFDLLDGLASALADLKSTIEQRTTMEVAGRSVGGRAVVRLRGGVPAEITLDERWLVMADTADITRHISDAFAAAYKQHGTVTLADMTAGGPIGKAFELSNDPMALLRRLGLSQ